MMNYYYSILFTCVQNVNQTRNRITHIHIRLSLSPCPAPDHFATSAPVSPLLGWLVCGCGWHPWLAAAASQLTTPPPPCPWSPRLAHLPALPHPPTPGSRPGRPAPTCAQHMCHARGQGTNNVSQSLMYIDTTDHSKSVSIPTINSCFIDF